MLKLIGKEIFLVILIGTLPLFIAYSNGGEKLLNEVIKELLASSFAINYAIFLSVSYVLVKVIFHYVYFKNEIAKSFLGFIVSILSEAGDATLGALRVATGIFLGFPLLWYIFEPETFNPTSSKLLIFGFFGFIDVCGLSFALHFIEKKWRH